MFGNPSSMLSVGLLPPGCGHLERRGMGCDSPLPQPRLADLNQAATADTGASTGGLGRGKRLSACVARHHMWHEKIVSSRRGIEKDSLRTPVSFLRTTPGGHQRNRFAGNRMGTLRRDVGTAVQRPVDGSSLGGSTLSDRPFCWRSFPL